MHTLWAIALISMMGVVSSELNLAPIVCNCSALFQTYKNLQIQANALQSQLQTYPPIYNSILNQLNSIQAQETATAAEEAALQSLVTATKAQVDATQAKQPGIQATLDSINTQEVNTATTINNYIAAEQVLEDTTNHLQAQETLTQSAVDALSSQQAATKQQVDTLQDQEVATQGQLDGLQGDEGVTESQLQGDEAHFAELLQQVAAAGQLNYPQLPEGFIYVQYPFQPQPSLLWTNYTWVDITSSYEGLFFRAGGGNAAPIGTNQLDSSPTITNFGSYSTGGGCNFGFVNVVNGNAIFTVSSNGGGYANGVIVTGADYGTEVRPTNQAIKIWRRI